MISTCIRRTATGLLLLAGLASSAPASDTTTHLTFGIVPQQSASRLAKMWAPLMAHIGTESSTEIEFRTTADIPTFEACLAAGAFDIAYMNPIHYTIFAEQTGYRALARQSKKKLRGIVVVRKDSPAQTLSDLDGITAAFPSPGAFGASVVPRAEMRAKGLDVTPNYVKSHDSVYRSVVAGIHPAGGGVLRTFNAVDEDIRNQLRVIYETDAYTPHAIATLPSVSEEIRGNILSALLEAESDLAQSVGMAGFEAGEDTDWDDVRSLELPASATGIGSNSAITCPFD